MFCLFLPNKTNKYNVLLVVVVVVAGMCLPLSSCTTIGIELLPRYNQCKHINAGRNPAIQCILKKKQKRNIDQSKDEQRRMPKKLSKESDEWIRNTSSII